MTVRGIDTYKPLLYFDVVGGRLTPDELAERTLSFTYVDRRRDFDHIDWKLDNRDGWLTHPQNICLGLMVRVSMGYADAIIPWKAFIINRIRGGVGVFGKENAAVGSNEASVTYQGRNRNAPGGRTSPHWNRRVNVPRKKPKKHHGPTEDVIGQDMVMLADTDQSAKYPRTVQALSTSEAVARIAARHGFYGANALIEPTEDGIESVTIPAGQSDGEFLNNLATLRDWVFKIEGGYLRWHSRNWPGAKRKVVAELTYGDGYDIKDLQIDNDFRLPAPTNVRARGVDFDRRRLLTQNLDADRAQKSFNVSIAYEDNLSLLDASQKRALTREETIPIVARGDSEALEKAARQFVKRHTRAFQISANCVGNPVLLADRLVKLAGTGTSMVDGIWIIEEARHEFSQMYQTKIILGPPPHNSRANTGDVSRLITGNLPADQANKTLNQSVAYEYGKNLLRTLASGK